jgi:putative transcriptional regulator
MRQNLRSLRETKGLTQQDMSGLVGVERSTYANIELGNKNPSFPVALKIKDALGYQGDMFFLMTNVPKGNNLSSGNCVVDSEDKSVEIT